jgi:FdhD protein
VKEVEINQIVERQNDLMRVIESNSSKSFSKDDYIVNETPVALEFNGISHAVMMVTPTDLKDFAIGFSLTEGIVDSILEIKGIDIFESEIGYRIAIEVINKSFEKLKERRRFLSGRSGCGICGLESLQAVQPVIDKTFTEKPPDFNLIQKAYDYLQNIQSLQKSGAMHAAMLVDSTGSVISVREDVGRHNALDKLIGSFVNIDTSNHFIMVSSRASFEMVNKTYHANIETLVSLSAPTSFAINLANQAKMNLIGFVKSERQITYSKNN